MRDEVSKSVNLNDMYFRRGGIFKAMYIIIIILLLSLSAMEYCWIIIACGEETWTQCSVAALILTKVTKDAAFQDDSIT